MNGCKVIISIVSEVTLEDLVVNYLKFQTRKYSNSVRVSWLDARFFRVTLSTPDWSRTLMYVTSKLAY
jgi:hypothetical protein